MKNLGLQSFCPGLHTSPRYMQKFAMPCPAHRLAGFSWFFAEAVLLTEKALRYFLSFGGALFRRRGAPARDPALRYASEDAGSSANLS